MYRICVPLAPNKRDSKYEDQLRKMYYFAEEYQMNELMNMIMDQIQDFQLKVKSKFKHDAILEVYDSTESVDSRLRWYCAVNAATYKLRDFGTKKKQDRPHMEPYLSIGKEHPQFLADLVRAESQHHHNILTHNANYRERKLEDGYGPCEFRVHAPGEICHSTGLVTPDDEIQEELAPVEIVRKSKKVDKRTRTGSKHSKAKKPEDVRTNTKRTVHNEVSTAPVVVRVAYDHKDRSMHEVVSSSGSGQRRVTKQALPDGEVVNGMPPSTSEARSPLNNPESDDTLVPEQHEESPSAVRSQKRQKLCQSVSDRPHIAIEPEIKREAFGTTPLALRPSPVPEVRNEEVLPDTINENPQDVPISVINFSAMQVADQPRIPWDWNLRRGKVNTPYEPTVVNKWWSRSNVEFDSMGKEARRKYSHIGRIMETELGERLDDNNGYTFCTSRGLECWRYSTAGALQITNPGDSCARCRMKAHVGGCSLNLGKNKPKREGRSKSMAPFAPQNKAKSRLNTPFHRDPGSTAAMAMAQHPNNASANVRVYVVRDVHTQQVQDKGMIYSRGEAISTALITMMPLE